MGPQPSLQCVGRLMDTRSKRTQAVCWAEPVRFSLSGTVITGWPAGQLWGADLQVPKSWALAGTTVSQSHMGVGVAGEEKPE